MIYENVPAYINALQIITMYLCAKLDQTDVEYLCGDLKSLLTRHGYSSANINELIWVFCEGISTMRENYKCQTTLK